MRWILTLIAFSLSFSAFAIEQGQTLPNITFENLGKLQLGEDNKIHYQTFSSKQLQGKRWLLQYIAPRMGVGKLNRELNDKMNKANRGKSCQTTSIINLDDALWGTKNIALGQMEKELKQNTHCIIIADDESLGVKKWGIPKKSNVNWVIDEQGKILFYHEGKLSPKQMQTIIGLLQS